MLVGDIIGDVELAAIVTHGIHLHAILTTAVFNLQFAKVIVLSHQALHIGVLDGCGQKQHNGSLHKFVGEQQRLVVVDLDDEILTRFDTNDAPFVAALHQCHILADRIDGLKLLRQQQFAIVIEGIAIAFANTTDL